MHLLRRAAEATLILVAILTIAGFSQLIGAPQFKKSTPDYGIRDKGTSLAAFTNATIVVSPTLTYEKATLLIRDGKIVGVGTSVSYPGRCRSFRSRRQFYLSGVCRTIQRVWDRQRTTLLAGPQCRSPVRRPPRRCRFLE